MLASFVSRSWLSRGGGPRRRALAPDDEVLQRVDFVIYMWYKATTMTLTPVTLRLPGELLAEAEALIQVASRRPELSTSGYVSRSAVLRLAIVLGLKQMRLENEKPPLPFR